MTLPKLAFSLAALTVFLVSSLAACGSKSSAPFDPALYDDGGTADHKSGTGPGGGDTICLLNNCDTNRECADCSGGRTTCLQKEHRCIACGPNAGGASCKQGEACTKYGDCVPNGTACAEGPTGVPTVSCGADADCAACGPKNRVCDVSSKKCVACVVGNVGNCQSTDVCVNDACVAACPATCMVDADCGKCGAPGKEAHACNNHRCAQCSAKTACAGGATCDAAHGVCKPPCGVFDANNPLRRGQCNTDMDCKACGGSATTCGPPPINGGLGVCGTPATGCSDLGKGVVVLPPPANEVTNLCSTDMDCANIGVQFNVGKALRDVTGLGIIKDANIPYGMHACASVKIIGGKSCGVCVPCKKDADCQDIDITKVAGDAFGPLGSIASTILLDKAFGPNDHTVHMYCDNVAGDYGVCVPCANILSSCSIGQPPPPGGKCDHDECTAGGALGTQCTACTAEVCANDPYCCTGSWDSLCTRAVDDYCTQKTCAPADSCEFKAPGWYCSTLQTYSSYECNTNMQISTGSQCAKMEYCHKQGTGPKSPAVLGSNGLPQCFPTP